MCSGSGSSGTALAAASSIGAEVHLTAPAPRFSCALRSTGSFNLTLLARSNSAMSDHFFRLLRSGRFSISSSILRFAKWWKRGQGRGASYDVNAADDRLSLPHRLGVSYSSFGTEPGGASSSTVSGSGGPPVTREGERDRLLCKAWRCICFGRRRRARYHDLPASGERDIHGPTPLCISGPNCLRHGVGLFASVLSRPSVGSVMRLRILRRVLLPAP